MHGRDKARDNRWAVMAKRFGVALAGVLLFLGLMLLGRSGKGAPPAAGNARDAETATPGAATLQVKRPGEATAVGAPGFSGQPASKATFNLGAVMNQVHFAYRWKDGAWRGGHTTYEVALRPGGELEVVPYHHPNARPGGAEQQPTGRREPAGLEKREPRRAEAVVEGSSVKLAPSSVARGGEVLSSGASEPATDGKGELEIAKGRVTERLKNGSDGVEQSWRFTEPPGGDGDLEVRVAVAGGEFKGETDAGLHFSGGKLGVRYGHATWIDALGVETPVPARWNGNAIVLRVPAAILEGSVYPAVLDPIISPELSMDEPVYGPTWSAQSLPKLASDGTDWLVVWQDGRSGSNGDIYGARVSGAGALLDPTGIAISTAAKDESYPAVAWNGTNYLVAWKDGAFGDATLRGARVSKAGEVLDVAGFAISATPNSGPTNPVIAWNGTQFLVAWYESRYGTNDIFCARVTAASEVLDPNGIAVSTAANAQVYPAVASDGTDWLVVWHDYRSGTSNTDVYGARIKGADGTVLDPSGIAISTAAGYQSDAAVAWDGANYLVVWRDTRNSSSSDDIYGARVSSAGAVLDPAGFAISTATNNQYYPALAWDGTNYVVVWIDARNAGRSHVYGARVSGAGAVLDPTGFAVSPASVPSFGPAVAWNGSSFLAVWEDHRSGTWADVYGARVSGTGTVLDASDILISQSANAQGTPAVAWDGTNYLVAWEDTRSTHADIYGARLRGADGSLLDASGIAISTAVGDQSSPAVAWDGTNYLVIWGTSYAGIFGARVSGAGGVLDPTGIAISTATNEQGSPAVSWDGTNYLVVWEESRGAPTYSDILGARVSGAGAVLDTNAIVISATPLAQQHPAVSWDGTNHLVVWEEFRSVTSFDILGARVSGAGAVLDTPALVISAAVNSELYPALAWDGTNYLAVWQDHRSGSSYDIYGARVSSAGVVLDASGIAISAEAGDQTIPAVAWDGTSHLVVWQDLRSGTSLDIYAAQVTPDGAALDAGGFLLSGSPSDERSPAVVASGPRRFLVAYSALDRSVDFGTHRVRARTVNFGSAPVAFAQSMKTAEDAPTGVTLGAADPGGGALTFSLVTSPLHGMLSGSGPDLIYTPAADYFGADSFTFKASSGTSESNVATVLITVTPVNDAPVAQGQAVTVAENGSLAIVLVATDVDGDPLTYAVVTQPAHGTLTGTGASLAYTPAAGFSGSDAFTFVANDGTVASNEATVSITVDFVNSAPVAQAQSVTLAANTSVAITFSATDADGDPLTYAVVAQPAHGTLTGTGASLTFTPAAGFSGSDAFTFVANDGTTDSAEATVSITVTPAESQAKGGCGCGTSGDAAPLGALLLLGVMALRRSPVRLTFPPRPDLVTSGQARSRPARR